MTGHAAQFLLVAGAVTGAWAAAILLLGWLLSVGRSRR